MVDHAANQIKLVSNDRVFVLKAIEGESSRNGAGIVDKRLFTGSNRLHAIRDGQTSLWSLKYDSGILPEPLKQSFTTFQKLREYVAGYFQRRGVQITEVLENFDA